MGETLSRSRRSLLPVLPRLPGLIGLVFQTDGVRSAAACWDYFRWTGDIAFLRQMYSLCKEGLDDYMPAVWGDSGNLWAAGGYGLAKLRPPRS